MGPEARYAISLRYRQTESGGSFMIVHAASRKPAGALHGRAMTREEVLAAPWKRSVFDIVDAIWVGDTRLFGPA